jgi:hypothetical protein
VGGRKLLKRARMALIGTPLGQAIVSIPGYEEMTEDEQQKVFGQVGMRFPADAAEIGDAENEALVVGYVISWTLDIPVTAEGVQNLDERDFDALVAEAKKIDGARVTAEQLADVSPEPASPTSG